MKSLPRLYRAWMLLLFLALVPRIQAEEKTTPDGMWRLLDSIPADKSAGDPNIRPTQGQPLALNASRLWDVIDAAPAEGAKSASPATITLPKPDGTLATFQIFKYEMMEAPLAAKYPEIRTLYGQGIDDPEADLRLDWTMHGLHVQVITSQGSYNIDPYTKGNLEYYTSYFKYLEKMPPFTCLVPGSPQGEKIVPKDTAGRSNGTQLRTYRVAIAATGEYTKFFGGTKSAGQSAIVTAINQVNGVYGRELAIRLVLVSNNDSLVYTNPNTDPFNNSDASDLIDKSQQVIDSKIGDANYDIGQVFSTAGGGLALLGVVCRTGLKAQAETGLPEPDGQEFWIDYVAHEMGHEFGANHTFNSTQGSCGGGNRNSGTAYEPGSGSTVMAYAGICSTDDLQSDSDPYFSFISFDEIATYTNIGAGNSCAKITSTGNSPPTVDAGSDFSIPKGTPFALTASGSDPNGDALTYSWEERDLGPATKLTDPDNGSSPIFRFFPPTSSPSRYFPRLSDVLNHTTTKGEILPTVGATRKFRVTARDNRSSGGGVNSDNMNLNIISSAGPFKMTSLNSGGSFLVGSSQTITWNVAGTNASPINTSNVNIYLSTDGGQTFPILLDGNTPNDGSESVTLPSNNTTKARIMIRPTNSVYYAVNDANFSIAGSANLVYSGVVIVTDTGSFANANGVLDPGERGVGINIGLKNNGNVTAQGITANLTSTSPDVIIESGSASYGTLAAGQEGGATPVFLIELKSSHPCGVPIPLVLNVSANGGAYTTQFNVSVNVGKTISSNTSTISADVPKAIPDNGSVSSNINMPFPGIVQSVRIKNLYISHTYSGDLKIRLRSPQGTEIILVNSNPNVSGDNAFAGTNFSDSGVGTISGSTALPYTQTFKPIQPFSTFAGQQSLGSWKLIVDDTATDDVGTLGNWILELTIQQTQCSVVGQNGVEHSDIYK